VITGPIIAEIAALVGDRFNRAFHIPSQGFWKP
jgi:hypothetical protein